MPPSRVIRIDDQVWAELQRRARPLEDTPNSVLRRVFELAEEGAGAEGTDSRVARLLELVQGLAGEAPGMEAARKGYSVLARTGQGVAYIRPQKERLRIEASKQVTEKAGLSNWDRERPAGFFTGPCVRWYAQDGDEPDYQRLAGVLAKLWQAGD